MHGSSCVRVCMHSHLARTLRASYSKLAALAHTPLYEKKIIQLQSTCMRLLTTNCMRLSATLIMRNFHASLHALACNCMQERVRLWHA